MNWVVRNLLDGSFQNVDEGGEARITWPTDRGISGGLGRGVQIVGDTALELTESPVNQVASHALYWTTGGDLSYSDKVTGWVIDSGDYKPLITLYFPLPPTIDGLFYQTLRFTDPNTNESSILVLRIQVVSMDTFMRRRPWLPAQLIDLEFDLGFGTVRSISLNERVTLSAGSEPTFALFVRLGAVFLVASIDEISLVIRRKNHFDEAHLIEVTGAAADLVATDGDHEGHYVFSGEFVSSVLQAAFVDRNAEAEDPLNLDRVQTLECLAQVALISAGKKYVSRLFPITFEQPCDERLLV